MQIILLDNVHNNRPEARSFVSAAADLGYGPAVDAYAEHSHDINGWGISRLPCLAAIHDTDGVAYYQVSDEALLPTFEADAAAALQAYEDAKLTAQEPPVEPEP